MDPTQKLYDLMSDMECLARFKNELGDKPGADQAIEDLHDDVLQGFDELWTWVKEGGFVPDCYEASKRFIESCGAKIAPALDPNRPTI